MTPILIICIIIFAAALTVGIVSGFLHSVLTIGHLFIAVALMALLFPYVKQGLTAVGVSDMIGRRVETVIEEKIEGSFDPFIDSADTQAQNEALEENVPLRLIRGFLQENNTAETYARLGVSAFTEYVGAYISDLLMTVISALTVFVLVEIILLILLILSKAVKKLPLIGKADRFFGGLLGACIGLGIIWLLFFFLTLAIGTQVGSGTISDIEADPVLSFIYSADPLMKIF